MINSRYKLTFIFSLSPLLDYLILYYYFRFVFSYTRYLLLSFTFFFFFNSTATTEIYPLSLHDALPIWRSSWAAATSALAMPTRAPQGTCTASPSNTRRAPARAVGYRGASRLERLTAARCARTGRNAHGKIGRAHV